NPELAEFEVEGGGAEGEQGDPLAVEFGNVTEGLAREAGAGQIMLVLQETVELGALLVLEQAHGNAFQNFGFARCQWRWHATVVETRRPVVQSILIPPAPSRTLPSQMKDP